ncbi:hypothetical protein NPS70_09280 [Streptomyces sp. C10-9-1]|uniref:hypothetical protein n=1 Tax=Streptomyces sp. C10-9-1 TaxID=1859285 RepID=UPI00211232B5|nr:hypothetical protein [Streptomyces sp. C10-9-1]MCQ6553384.1 hypothetical protein [Streptomyces sp. C10-9-1]
MDRSTGAGADGDRALLRPVRAADVDRVERLLREGGRPGTLDAAFRLAVRTRAGYIAQLLLAHGADPGASGPGELPPLRDAVASGSPALVGALLDDPERRVGLTAVQGLALHGDDRCVEAARRLGPPRPEHPDEEHLLGAAWRHAWRHDGR